jgi:hypothetical protein
MLSNISKEIATSGDWKNLMKEEEEALLRELQEEKENKQKVPVIRPKHVAQDIEGTMSKIDPEVFLSLPLSFHWIIDLDFQAHWTFEMHRLPNLLFGCSR